MSAAILDKVWDGAGDSWHWLRGVLLGEWEDDRSLSQIVTDALAGMVPGVGSIITLRDLIAVIVRLARHPEKREHVDEWILLVAMLLPLLITLAGVVVAGVGALVGAELGGFLRCVALFMVKKGGVGLKAMVEFFNAHGYGDVIKALRQVKFAAYKDQLVKYLGEHIERLLNLVKGFQARIEGLSPQSLPHWLPGREAMIRSVAFCKRLRVELEALRVIAHEMIPKALLEMDQRLAYLLAGDVKAATQVTHTITAGQAAPEVARLTHEPGRTTMVNPHPPEPGNVRRMNERRIVALKGKREYRVTDAEGRPVGAKPYEQGVTKVEHPALERVDWVDLGRSRVKDGWPDLNKEFRPGEFSTEYDTFSGYIRAQSVQAGSKSTFTRIVSHDVGSKTDHGAFWNRELPIDGRDMRSSSAIKERWSKNGEYVVIDLPPPGHPVWKEVHALQEKSAGHALPYKEELKFWEGPAASQVYQKKLPDGTMVSDEWYLAGGKPQQFFDRDQMEALKRHGFIREREPTKFPDFDPETGTIVPSDSPWFEVVPLHEAVPPVAKAQGATPK